jgi:hypothetical protein
LAADKLIAPLSAFSAVRCNKLHTSRKTRITGHISTVKSAVLKEIIETVNQAILKEIIETVNQAIQLINAEIG